MTVFTEFEEMKIEILFNPVCTPSSPIFSPKVGGLES